MYDLKKLKEVSVITGLDVFLVLDVFAIFSVLCLRIGTAKISSSALIIISPSCRMY